MVCVGCGIGTVGGRPCFAGPVGTVVELGEPHRATSIVVGGGADVA